MVVPQIPFPVKKSNLPENSQKFGIGGNPFLGWEKCENGISVKRKCPEFGFLLSSSALPGNNPPAWGPKDPEPNWKKKEGGRTPFN